MTPSEEPFRIRDYRAADFGRLCEIDRLCFSEAIAYTPQEVSLGLAQPGAFALVAERGDQILGFVLACLSRRQLGHIITIDVLGEFRRSGLGRQLMELAEQRLSSQGARRVVLEVDLRNDPAIRFYRRLGYVHRRRLPHYYPDGADADLMEKALGIETA
jgi:[ribosomal protein S18]-alanine N-acetyltransferase